MAVFFKLSKDGHEARSRRSRLSRTERHGIGSERRNHLRRQPRDVDAHVPNQLDQARRLLRRSRILGESRQARLFATIRSVGCPTRKSTTPTVVRSGSHVRQVRPSAANCCTRRTANRQCIWCSKEEVGGQDARRRRAAAQFDASWRLPGPASFPNERLFLTGLRGWQTNASKDAGFYRVRHTGKPLNLPVDMNVKKVRDPNRFLRRPRHRVSGRRRTTGISTNGNTNGRGRIMDRTITRSPIRRKRGGTNSKSMCRRRLSDGKTVTLKISIFIRSCK